MKMTKDGTYRRKSDQTLHRLVKTIANPTLKMDVRLRDLQTGEEFTVMHDLFFEDYEYVDRLEVDIEDVVASLFQRNAITGA